ncbi:pyruvate kinase [Bartonella henselae]|uniref:Pyruvate kinase n=1 Tax=Bartonella henselae TaxID=38323 RepID=X5MGR8_BARHN|nr:hypothetical protein [Bartonella henselae]ETS10810.1 hypothetical protein Q653_00531 [Bartonella henselae JK 42]KEC60882.1 hypothetical protein O95_00325 [Bartonella henselae JK 53]CDO47534.1 pyruvate kinase [Bartonella henselae]
MCDVPAAVYVVGGAVMLSADLYLEEAVLMMDRIAQQIKQDQTYAAQVGAQHPAPESTGTVRFLSLRVRSPKHCN